MNAGIFSMQSIAIYKLKQRGLNLTPCRILYLFKKLFSVDHVTHSKLFWICSYLFTNKNICRHWKIEHNCLINSYFGIVVWKVWELSSVPETTLTFDKYSEFKGLPFHNNITMYFHKLLKEWTPRMCILKLSKPFLEIQIQHKVLFGANVKFKTGWESYQSIK